ncbi:hypothetical protein [Streptomyces sp. NBC_00829]|uniref:hypothetical protein n=1 Tax=Streptomyces sp. NBC_00829 TaxID=2903679 RepID=UPI003862FB64|nr:hypothetical protein OG293_37000 [Streptomyces sp. NBC_00829]
MRPVQGPGDLLVGLLTVSAELVRRRLTGEDFATIARELDYPDAADAAADFAQALAAEPFEPAVRHEADQRAFDELQHAVWDSATDGDLDAIATARPDKAVAAPCGGGHGDCPLSDGAGRSYGLGGN